MGGPHPTRVILMGIIPSLRKGVLAHVDILQSYVNNSNIKDDDIVVLVDLLPNRWLLCGCLFRVVHVALCLFLCLVSSQCLRHAEFGRAVLTRQLENNHRRPPMYYFGCLREDEADVVTSLEEMVYNHWDSSEAAPPASRPTETPVEPTLSFLSWDGSAPRFPESALAKFAPGTAARQEIQSLKAQLTQAFPESGTAQRPSAPNRQRPRVAGRPDYSIEGGKTPLDCSRLLELEHYPAADFNLTRQAFSPGFWFSKFEVSLKSQNFQIQFGIRSKSYDLLGSQEGILRRQQGQASSDCGWQLQFVRGKRNWRGTRFWAMRTLRLQFGAIRREGCCRSGYRKWKQSKFSLLWIPIISIQTLQTTFGIFWWGLGEQELSGIPFRFGNDLQLVVFERKLIAISEFFHHCSAAMGLADFELVNHVLTQKQYPPVIWIVDLNQSFFFAKVALSYPIISSIFSFEFVKHSLRHPKAKKRFLYLFGTTCPQPGTGSAMSSSRMRSETKMLWGAQEINLSVLRLKVSCDIIVYVFCVCVFSVRRHATIGAVWLGHMDKLPKSPKASVAWEVSCLRQTPHSGTPVSSLSSEFNFIVYFFANLYSAISCMTKATSQGVGAKWLWSCKDCRGQAEDLSHMRSQASTQDLDQDFLRSKQHGLTFSLLLVWLFATGPYRPSIAYKLSD